MRPIPYGRQQITDEDIAAVCETLRSDFLTQGPKVLEFEKKFSEYVDAKYAVAVTNGTAALHLAAMALGLKASQKVLVPNITFAASANCVLYCGGQVEFIDIDPETYCIDLRKLEQKLLSSPKGTYSGVIPVDFAGYPVDMEGIRKLADKFNLWVLEDACHAPGGAFRDSKKIWQKCGNGIYSDLTVFSFHPVKHIACGEGGMISTNNQQLYEKLLMLRTHGITKEPNKFSSPSHGGWYHEMQILGYNYRIPDMLCALGTSQLGRAEQNMGRRHQIADRYDVELAELPLILPKRHNDVKHAFHLYVVQTERRAELYEFLKSKGIYAQVLYLPVTSHPFYKEMGYRSEDTPQAVRYYERALALPMFHGLTNEEQSYVISSVKDFFR